MMVRLETSRYRSWMFVPGNRQRFLDKVQALEVDVALLDLEDGVPPSEKAEARRQIHAALEADRIPALRYVRVNEVGSPWFEEDLAVVVGGALRALDGVCLPKVESPDEIARLDRDLGRLEERAAVAPDSIGVIAAIESARGLTNVSEIAAAPRVAGLMLGSEDFALSLGLSPLREAEAKELLYVRSAIVVAAGAADILSIDGVYPDYKDQEGLRRDAEQARRLGFDGKALFHPGQLEQINRTFSPSDAEILYSRRVVAAYREATERGEGAVAVGGQLVDRPIVLRAQRILDFVKDENTRTHGEDR